MSRQSAALSFVTQHVMSSDFAGKWKTKPNLLWGFSVKLQKTGIERLWNEYRIRLILIIYRKALKILIWRIAQKRELKAINSSFMLYIKSHKVSRIYKFAYSIHIFYIYLHFTQAIFSMKLELIFILLKIKSTIEMHLETRYKIWWFPNFFLRC